MAKHISYSFREHQIALLGEMTAIKFKELYEQRFPLPKPVRSTLQDKDDDEQ